MAYSGWSMTMLKAIGYLPFAIRYPPFAEGVALYTPPHNRERDRAKILAFMRAYRFATLVTACDDAPKATHLPFVIEECDDAIQLIAHLAKANEQWRDLAEEREALVIFQEPHAYISPKHYEKHLSVPTWNYVAVHAYGRAKILDMPDEQVRALKQLIHANDSDYMRQFDSLPADFVAAKLKGIVAFEITVTQLQARFKLSQDRTPTEREHIIAALSHDDDTVKATIGALMANGLSLMADSE
jgi:transcriptional regulator